MLSLVGGDWNHGILYNLNNLMTFHIFGITIPTDSTDFRIFFRGVGIPPTSCSYTVFNRNPHSYQLMQDFATIPFSVIKRGFRRYEIPELNGGLLIAAWVFIYRWWIYQPVLITGGFANMLRQGVKPWHGGKARIGVAQNCTFRRFPRII